MNVAVWLLAVLGLTTIVTESRLFRPLREWLLARSGSHFLSCALCVGFWAGLLVAVASAPLPHTGSGEISLALSGFAGSWISWTARVALRRLGSDEL